MDVSRPYSAIAPTVEGDVLFALAGSERAMSGRQVARLVRRGSQPAVNAALERLTAQGVVLREEAPPAYLYRLNRDHVGAPAVLALADMRSGVPAPTAYRPLPPGRCRRCTHPCSAPPPGATATVQATSTSSSSVRAASPTTMNAGPSQLSELSDAVRAWTGNEASIIEFAQERLGAAAQGEPSSALGASSRRRATGRRRIPRGHRRASTRRHGGAVTRPSAKGRTRPCSAADARKRLADAQK